MWYVLLNFMFLSSFQKKIYIYFQSYIYDFPRTDAKKTSKEFWKLLVWVDFDRMKQTLVTQRNQQLTLKSANNKKGQGRKLDN